MMIRKIGIIVAINLALLWGIVFMITETFFTQTVIYGIMLAAYDFPICRGVYPNTYEIYGSGKGINGLALSLKMPFYPKGSQWLEFYNKNFHYSGHDIGLWTASLTLLSVIALLIIEFLFYLLIKRLKRKGWR